MSVSVSYTHLDVYKRQEEALGEVPENDPEEMDKSNDEELALEESLGEDKEQ